MNIDEAKALIENRLISLYQEQNDLKINRDILTQELLKDNMIVELNQEIKDLQKKRRQRKELLIAEDYSLQDIVGRLAEVRQSIDDHKRVLSAELLELHKQTGDYEFTDSKGELWRFRFDSKVKHTDQPSLFQGVNTNE